MPPTERPAYRNIQNMQRVSSGDERAQSQRSTWSRKRMRRKSKRGERAGRTGIKTRGGEEEEQGGKRGCHSRTYEPSTDCGLGLMIEERSRLNDPCPRVLGSPLAEIHRGVPGVPSLPTAKLGRVSHRCDGINFYVFTNPNSFYDRITLLRP